MSFVAPIIRSGLRQVGRYVYQGLRQQEKIIDYTYRKTGLYNRGIVRGIKHGLAGGQIIGGGLSLGLNAPDTPGNGGSIPFQKSSKTRKPYQTRYRRTSRYCPSGTNRFRSDQSRRRSSYRKY